MLRSVGSLVCAGLLGLVLATEARADSITITLDGPIVGQPTSPSASGSPTITFTDTGTNEVTMTMSLAGMSSSEKLKEWYFNSSIDPTGFTFTHVSGDTATAIDLVFNSTSNWKADGSGGYHDIRFSFSTSGSSAFKGGETVVYKISGTGLTAAKFDTYGITSADDGEVYRSVVHLLGIAIPGSTDTASKWIGDVGTPVPEPGSIALLAAGLAAIGLRRRRAAGSTDINV